MQYSSKSVLDKKRRTLYTFETNLSIYNLLALEHLLYSGGRVLFISTDSCQVND